MTALGVVHWSWQTWGWIGLGLFCVVLMVIIYLSVAGLGGDDDD